MAQEVILVLAVVAAAIFYNVIQWYLGLLIIPGALALGLHIYGDLRPAFVTQARSRDWLDRKIEKGGGLRPKI